MVGRWVAVLALLVSGLVLGSATPAAACGCVTDQIDQLVDSAAVAFVGVLTSQRVGDDDVAHRFTVSTVYRGEVHRTQDVVTPTGGSAACGVEWKPGVQMVMLGYVDEASRIASNVCTGSTTLGASADGPVVARLGTGSEPLAGEGLVELGISGGGAVRWPSLAVGAIGLTGVGWIALRRRRTPDPG